MPIENKLIGTAGLESVADGKKDAEENTKYPRQCPSVSCSLRSNALLKDTCSISWMPAVCGFHFSERFGGECVHNPCQTKNK